MGCIHDLSKKETAVYLQTKQDLNPLPVLFFFCFSSCDKLITSSPEIDLTPNMRLFAALCLLLLLRFAEPRRGRRSDAAERGSAEWARTRGRGRAGVVRRQTQECKEYFDAGEKYLDCQDRGLTTVMEGWPKDIHHLLLARNKIQASTGRSQDIRHVASAAVLTRAAASLVFYVSN